MCQIIEDLQLHIVCGSFVDIVILILQQLLIFLCHIGPSHLCLPIVSTQSQLIKLRISFPRIPALEQDRRDLRHTFCPLVILVIGFVVIHDSDRRVHFIVEQSAQDHVIMQRTSGSSPGLCPPSADVLLDPFQLALIQPGSIDIKHRLLAHHQPAGIQHFISGGRTWCQLHDILSAELAVLCMEIHQVHFLIFVKLHVPRAVDRLEVPRMDPDISPNILI